MTIVDLGTRPLTIGASLVAFNTFSFRQRRAYLIRGEFNISTFDNVFSNVVLIPSLNVNNRGQFSHPDIVIIQPRTKRFSFFLPFSQVFGGNGDATILGFRESIREGTADQQPDLELSLNYDDEDDIRTWLG